MALYEDENHFAGLVDVDGHVFRRCTFKGVTLRYSGGEPPGLEQCHFEDCTLSLDGAAARTIGYLAAVHGGLGDWGRANVDNLFASIRGDSSGVQRPN